MTNQTVRRGIKRLVSAAAPLPDRQEGSLPPAAPYSQQTVLFSPTV